MSTETETPIEEKKTPTTRFAEWLMARQEKKEAKETSLESLMKFNIFFQLLHWSRWLALAWQSMS